jgi:hypothetical protein
MNKYISVVSNFICTNEKRLQVLRDQIKNLAFIFNDCNFLINYNTDTNYDEVKHLFESNIKSNKLFFNHDLTRDWGRSTLDLLQRCETKYVFYLLEDYVYDYNFNSAQGSQFASHILSFDDDRLAKISLDTRKIFWQNMIQECIENDVKHVFLAKIKKYLPPSQFITVSNNYIEGKNVYFYLAKNSPTGVFSSSAIHSSDVLVEVLKNHIKKYVSKTPGEFEQNSEFIRQMGDMQCAIPKDDITIQAHIDGAIDR